MKSIVFLSLFLGGIMTLNAQQLHPWFQAVSRPAVSAPVGTPPLDQVGSAAAAYSLRLLRTAYTGSAIRIRRESDNAQQDIGFVSGELNTAAITSFAGAGAAYVVTVYDQSGNGRDITQISTTAQPLIKASGGGVVTRNSKPFMQLDGNDFLEGPDIMGGVTSEVVVCLVVELYSYNLSGSGNFLFKLKPETFGYDRFFVLLPWTDGTIYWDIGSINSPTTYNRVSVASQFNINTLYQFSFVGSIANNVQAIRKNGTIIASDGTGATSGTGTVTIGNIVQGYLSELIVYKQTFSNSTINTVEQNQGNFFGITVN